MSLLLGDMLVRYKADVTDLSVKSAIAGAEITGVANKAKAADSGLGNLSGATTFAKVLGTALLAGTVAVVGMGVASVKMAGDFETSTNKLVTSAGESRQNIDMIRQGILRMSVDTATSWQQLSDGMYMVESAGYRASDALKILGIAARGSKAEGADLQTVTYTLTGILHDYHLGTNQATGAMNALITAVGSGKMRLQDLAGAVGTILPLASSLHVRLEDVIGATAAMTNSNTTAALATQHLAFVLSALSAPNKQAVKAMAEVGLTAQQVKDSLSTNGLAGTLQMIEEHVGSKFPANSVASVTALKHIMGGVVGWRTELALTGDNMKAFQGNVNDIAKAFHQGGDSVQNWDVVQSSFNFKIGQAKNAVDALMIGIGTQLLPVLGNIAQQITPAITGFTKWLTEGDRLKNAITGVAGAISATVTTISNIVTFFKNNQYAFAGLVVGVILLAGAIGGVLVASLVAAAVAAWAAIIPLMPFILIGAAVAAVIAIIVIAVMHWGEIAHWLQGVWAGFTSWLSSVWGGFSSWFMGLLGNIGNFFKTIWSGISSAFKATVDWIVNAGKIGFQFLLSVVLGPIFAIVNAFSWLYNHNYYFKALVDSIVNFFKAGFSWLTDQWNKFTGWIAGVWKGISDKASEIWGGITSTVGSKTKDTTNALQGAWNTAGSWLGDKWKSFVQLNIDTWNAVSGVAKLIWTKYLQPPLQAAWNSVVNFMSGWPKDALQAGVNFIQMLVQGITSGAGAIWNAVTGIAQNIWKALGFHSPTEAGPGRTADKWMPALITMMEGGLKAGVPKIQQAAYQVAAPLAQMAYPIKPSAAAIAVAAGSAQSNNGGQNTYIFEVDSMQLAKITGNATDRYVRLKLGAGGRAA